MLVCIGVFYAVGRYMDIPDEPGFSMSLLGQSTPVMDLVVTALATWVCLIVATLIAGSVRYDAGLVAASVGMVTLSVRGGPMRTVLQAATGPGIYLRLIVEMLLLWLIVAGSTALVRWVVDMKLVKRPDLMGNPQSAQSKARIGFRITAVAFQTAIMALVLWAMAQSDAKAQVIVSTFLGSLAGAALAAGYFHDVGATWATCIAPLLVGVLGYALAYLNPSGLAVGHTMETLARPLPIDYASAGCAGAILGAWIASRHHVRAVESLIALITGRSSEHSPTAQRQGR